MTLRLRLLLVLVGIVAAGLLVADVVTYTSLRSYLYSQVDQQLQAAPGPVSSALSTCLQEERGGLGFFPSSNTCRLPISEDSQIPTGTWGQLRDANGKVLISLCFVQGRRASPNPGLPASLPIAQNSASASVFSVTGTGCESASYNAVAVDATQGLFAGAVVVVAAVPLTSVDQTLGRLVLIELLVSLAVLVALGMLAWWMVRRGLRPLDEMATTAGAIAAGDLSKRVSDDDSHTEVGKLGAALNTMLSEIEQAFAARTASEDRLRRFLADASHELRTPLTSIRGYAELFDRGARDRPEDLATSMRHIREDANRMSVLVDDLLLLARLDRKRPLAHDSVNLAEITAAAVEAARVSAPERAIDFESSGQTVVVGDADRLRQAIDNLLRNAVQHTPAGTPIEVRLRAEPAQVGIEVTDHGQGIPVEERERIFEPFHRADPSRARSSGGVGLGLAIVSAIARAHGGTVGVTSNGAAGATFWIRIPREPTGPTSSRSAAPVAETALASGDGPDQVARQQAAT
jgi:two-component system OmpR family sensor kinase